MSSSSKLLDEYVFFIDRSLGKKAIANALKNAGLNVVIHDDCFPQNTLDEVWLDEVGKKGWIVLSKDNRIRYRANEISALNNANVLAFFLTATNATGDEMASIFLKARKRMIDIASKSKRPAIYTLGRDAKPKLIL